MLPLELPPDWALVVSGFRVALLYWLSNESDLQDFMATMSAASMRTLRGHWLFLRLQLVHAAPLIAQLP